MESMAMYRRDSSHDMGLLELGPLGLTGARLDLDDLPLVVADGDGLDVVQSRQTTRGWLPGVVTDDGTGEMVLTDGEPDGQIDAAADRSLGTHPGLARGPEAAKVCGPGGRESVCVSERCVEAVRMSLCAG